MNETRKTINNNFLGNFLKKYDEIKGKEKGRVIKSKISGCYSHLKKKTRFTNRYYILGADFSPCLLKVEQNIESSVRKRSKRIPLNH